MKTKIVAVNSAVNIGLASLYESIGRTMDMFFKDLPKEEGENYGLCKLHRDNSDFSSIPLFFDGKNQKDVLWNDKAQYTIFCLENDAAGVIGGISHEVTLFVTSQKLISFGEEDLAEIISHCAAKVGIFPKKTAFGALNVFAPVIQKTFKAEDYAMYSASITFNLITSRKLCS